MVWGLIVLAIGLLYGWFTPGRQDKGAIFRTGLLIGLVLAGVFALIGLAGGMGPLGFGTGPLWVFLDVVILTLLFMLGAWLGDLIEGASRRRRVA